MLQCTASVLQLRRTALQLKRSGKPTEVLSYKQVYLPYDVPPTKMEMESARKKLSVAYHGKLESRRLVEVRNVPQNVYTYGKEGMSVPIAIFKDQPDPVIGPEWTYPGIYENRIAAQTWYLEELFDREAKGSFESPFMRKILDNQVKRRINRVGWRMTLLQQKAIDVFQKERAGVKRAGEKDAAAPSGKDSK